MTINTYSVDNLPASGRLTGQLVDGITDVVATPGNPYARAAVISGLIGEICATVEWLHGTNTQHEELASLHRVLAEAQQHQTRMEASAAVPRDEMRIEGRRPGVNRPSSAEHP